MSVILVDPFRGAYAVLLLLLLLLLIWTLSFLLLFFFLFRSWRSSVVLHFLVERVRQQERKDIRGCNISSLTMKELNHGACGNVSLSFSIAHALAFAWMRLQRRQQNPSD